MFHSSAFKAHPLVGRAVALLIPLAVLSLLEFTLRLGGVASYPELFVPAQMNGFLQPNEDVIERFFSHPGAAPSVSIDTTYFADAKPSGALRIFVQGGSTAAGFPYGKWASPAGMLKHRLRRSFPERDIEVINTAMSAINSYALLDFADEIIEQEPDAVVIYAGHNEYLGVLGVGSVYSSSISPALTRMIMRLRHLRLYRLLEQTVGALRTSEPIERSGTLMATIAGGQSIPYGSELFEKGAIQFEQNMGELLAKYKRAGVAVFIGTLASNERDQTPFKSEPSPGTDESAWRLEYQRGLEARNRGELDTAIDAYNSVLDLDDQIAEVWHALGQALIEAQDGVAAEAALVGARDRDQLRFRAPGIFNVALGELAIAHGATQFDQQIRHDRLTSQASSLKPIIVRLLKSTLMRSAPIS